ncbi:MAG: hypothetical protein ACI4EJ_10695 [Bacteroides sp.]
MAKETAYEAVAYENDSKNAEELLKVLKDCGMEDAYSEYDEISASHTLYVSNKDFSRAEDIVMTFYDDLDNADSNSDKKENDTDGNETDCESVNSSSIYASSDDKYHDNLSSAYTFLVFGVIGIIFVILYDFGLIPVFSMTLSSKILFNIVMVILFVGFIVTGILSLKYSKKLKLQIDVYSAKSDDIAGYLADNLSREDIESSYDGTGLPEEMCYYRRIDAIRNCIVDKFGEQPEEFMNEMCDKYYNSIFNNEQ